MIRACRELDLRTVAVYSEADAAAPHVRLADEAVAIGPPPARESYLVIDKIVDAIRKQRRRRRPPGLRLPLGERRVRRGGRTRRARRSSARRRRRSGRWAARRRRARACRRRASRSCPATTAPRGAASPTRPTAKAAAARIGYPVMLKAAAGGGGRGMRLVDSRGEAGGGAGGRAARGEGGVRRRHGLSGEGDRPAAPHRDPGVRRRARRRGPPLRARLLDPAPQPEGDRGVALAGDRRRDARENGRGGGAGPPARSATSAPARSRCSTTRPRAASTSWR